MAKFATQSIVNLPTGTYNAKVASVSPPRTSRNGNMTCSIQFKSDGGSAFQYCNVGADAIAVTEDADGEPMLSLPDNTDIFVRKMAAAGIETTLDPDALLEAMQVDDDLVRNKLVAETIYQGLKSLVGVTCTIRTECRNIPGIGNRTTVTDILSDDSAAEAEAVVTDDEFDQSF